MKYSHSYLMLILLIVLFENFAQYNIKKNLLKNNIFFILLAVASYGIVCLLLGKCYEINNAGVGITNFIWSILSIISVLIMGYIIFNEKITKYDMYGIVLCTVGLYYIFIVGHY